MDKRALKDRVQKRGIRKTLTIPTDDSMGWEVNEEVIRGSELRLSSEDVFPPS